MFDVYKGIKWEILLKIKGLFEIKSMLKVGHQNMFSFFLYFRNGESNRTVKGENRRLGPDFSQPQCRLQEQNDVGSGQGLPRLPALLHSTPCRKQ